MDQREELKEMHRLLRKINSGIATDSEINLYNKSKKLYETKTKTRRSEIKQLLSEIVDDDNKPYFSTEFLNKIY